ncbi:AAA family ATPase [Gorillibacterium timonense]|uniref:AAA family ATPase n=1 Tax=Gorillibacterium timonense TaxID=1689269 RepID=UPI00071D517D|nr:MoxR family ATPase [Gorillibacterium timonense]
MSILPNNRTTSLREWDQPEILTNNLIRSVERVVVGKRGAIELCVVSILARGHVLIEDVPGTGKTLLVKALARSLDCSFKRIQFTPDLLPSDVTGASVYHPVLHSFEFRQGPLFANLVLADELNRTPAKTQAAMLEAMEEKQITADGERHTLPEPFILLATQNPVEAEGTFSLPEAQLDRFMLRVRLGYPELQEETVILSRRAAQTPLESLRPVLMREELLALQVKVDEIYVDETLCEYIARLAAYTRAHRDAALGASPRASVALMRAAQAKAFMAGRPYVIPDDIKELAVPAFAHRILLTSAARYAGRSAEELVNETLERTAVPGIPMGRGARS